MVFRAVALVVLAVAAVTALVYSRYQTEPLKVSGFIEAYEIRIGSRVGGRVKSVVAEEGSAVKAGQTLVELDPYDLLEQRAQAQAELAARVAQHDKLAAGFRPEETAQAKARYDRLAAQLEMLERGPRSQEIAAAEARVRLAEAELVLAQEHLARIEPLVARNAATREQQDEAVTQLRVARATLDVREQELAQLREGTRPEEIAQAKAQLEEARQDWQLHENGFRSEEIAEAQAAIESARSVLQAIERRIAELTVAAPVDAIVEAVELRPGDMVGPNSPVLSLMDTSRLWVRAYVPEDELDVQIDQIVPVSVDSFPGETFRGRITFVARQAEFTPSNVQTPDERSKQVFRIRVELEEGRDRLRPGMSADVWLEPAKKD
jgi:multidrug resistance efflux pump